jgi:hypothetical protein
MTGNTNKTTTGDIALALTKGGLGAIPVIGSLATETFRLSCYPAAGKAAGCMDE